MSVAQSLSWVTKANSIWNQRHFEGHCTIVTRLFVFLHAQTCGLNQDLKVWTTTHWVLVENKVRFSCAYQEYCFTLPHVQLWLLCIVVICPTVWLFETWLFQRQELHRCFFVEKAGKLQRMLISVYLNFYKTFEWWNLSEISPSLSMYERWAILSHFLSPY